MAGARALSQGEESEVQLDTLTEAFFSPCRSPVPDLMLLEAHVGVNVGLVKMESALSRGSI